MSRDLAPISFEPLFMERIWGGRRLETGFGKKLPADARIGESWEIVDRPEAQSVVRDGPFRGLTLHDLWTRHRPEIFGKVADSPRFPLLIKLLDAREKLSLQVHPPAEVARKLGGEPKTEFWYVADAEPGAELYVGLREATTREKFHESLRAGTAADHFHTIKVQRGDAMFLPSGRFHAVGGGNLLVEVQQNSDTTYRVFDWNRTDGNGKPRALHVEEALESIDFTDCRPGLVRPEGERLVRNDLFEVQKWELVSAREAAPPGQFAIVVCVEGSAVCGSLALGPGEFCLVPAQGSDRTVAPAVAETAVLRIAIPA